jgi:hypothetical protein
LLEHATKPTTDEQKNHVQMKPKKNHRQMSLFGTAPRQVTGNFGDNGDYAKVMNKFTTDPTNIDRYATGNGKKVELQNAGKRVLHAGRAAVIRSYGRPTPTNGDPPTKFTT